MDVTTVQPLLLTLDETAAVLKVGRSTVYALIRAGELDSVKIGTNHRVALDDVKNYVNRLRGKAA